MIILPIFLAFTYLFYTTHQQNALDWQPNSYPKVKRDDTVFHYKSALNGTVTIKDPYYWLEHSTPSSSERIKYRQDQTELFQNYLKKSGSNFDKIQTSVRNAGLYDFMSFPESYGPSVENPMYIYRHTNPNSTKLSVFVANQTEIDQACLTKFAKLPGKKVFDEATLAPFESMWHYNLSPDGNKVLLQIINPDGNHAPTIYIKDLQTKYDDTLQGAEKVDNASALLYTWLGDSSGFFYTHFQQYDWNEFNATVRFHRLQGEDIEIVSVNEEENGSYEVQISDDHKFLFVHGSSNQNYYSSLYATSLVDRPISENMKWISIDPNNQSYWDYATNFGNEFYFHTNLNAENYEIVRIKLDFSKAKTVTKLTELQGMANIESIGVPEDKEAYFDAFAPFDGGKIIVSLTRNGRIEYFLYDLPTGKRIERVVPENSGSASAFAALPYGKDIYLWYWSFNTPGEIVRFRWNNDSQALSSELVYRATVELIDTSKYIVEQRWTASKDGTLIPFFLCYRKGLNFDGTHPLMVNYYAAYSFRGLPYYNPAFLSWIDQFDGVLALVLARGGAEVGGEKWHLDAIKEKKQNTVDDVHWVINHLIDEKITSSGKVIINVEAAPSMVALALANQMPEGVLGAIIAKRGIYDLLQIDQTLDSVRLENEYGNPQDPNAFDWLIKLSPYQNINASKAYPTILFFPDKDDETYHGSVWHAFKMVANLQFQRANNTFPFLLTEPNDSLPNDDNDVIRNAQAFAITAHTLGLKVV